MIVHTIESYWIPSQKNTKSNLQIKKIRQNFWILKRALHATHPLKLLDKMCKYDIFKCIFLNENVWIPIKISLKFVPKGPINNNPALV